MESIQSFPSKEILKKRYILVNRMGIVCKEIVSHECLLALADTEQADKLYAIEVKPIKDLT